MIPLRFEVMNKVGNFFFILFLGCMASATLCLLAILMFGQQSKDGVIVPTLFVSAFGLSTIGSLIFLCVAVPVYCLRCIFLFKHLFGFWKILPFNPLNDKKMQERVTEKMMSIDSKVNKGEATVEELHQYYDTASNLFFKAKMAYRNDMVL